MEWLGYTQSRIQQNQPVEFDWFGTVANATHPWLCYTHVLNPTKAAGGVWWIWYSSKCKASMAWLYTVPNPTKAAGGVWRVWYTWLHALFAGLCCGGLNPSKSAKIRRGLWRIWGVVSNMILIQLVLFALPCAPLLIMEFGLCTITLPVIEQNNAFIRTTWRRVHAHENWRRLSSTQSCHVSRCFSVIGKTCFRLNDFHPASLFVWFLNCQSQSPSKV